MNVSAVSNSTTDLATDVPNSETDIFVLDCFNVEAYAQSNKTSITVHLTPCTHQSLEWSKRFHPISIYTG